MTALETCANEYDAACVAMQPLWQALLRAPIGSDDRKVAIAAYTAGRERCAAARVALLTRANGGKLEVGA